MSYILEALKKADAERERGSVPGLHSQPQTSVAEDDEPSRSTLPLVWVGAGVAITVISLLGWQLWRRPASSPEPASVSAEVAQPQAGDAPATSPPQPPDKLDRPAADRTATGWQPPAAPPPPRSPTAGATRATSPEPLSRPERPTRAANTPADEPAPAHQSSHAGKKADASGGQAQASVPTAAELPDEIRRELPQMVVGGAMYSDTPATRMLVINSQVLHEGDQAAPGVVLQEIRLKSAVLSYKGHRYSITY